MIEVFQATDRATVDPDGNQPADAYSHSMVAGGLEEMS